MNTVNIKVLENGTPFYTDDNEKRIEKGDSGYDLYITETTIIPPFTTALLPLGISASSDYGGGLFVMARSSVWKRNLMMCNSIGLIDMGYRGEIKAPIYNGNSTPQEIESGTRLCQLVLPNAKPFIVKFVDELSDTIRGDGGFGSTGIK
jgi:dUTP pyrophosphatase